MFNIFNGKCNEKDEQAIFIELLACQGNKLIYTNV